MTRQISAALHEGTFDKRTFNKNRSVWNTIYRDKIQSERTFLYPRHYQITSGKFDIYI